MTTEQKHTPGPWRIAGNLFDGLTVRCGDAGIGSLIANVCSQAERGANARLIARAPDLLSENERLRAKLEDEIKCAIWLREDLEKTKAQNAELLAALREIAEHKHCIYSDSVAMYDIGVVDGHRCAAGIARAAIAKAEAK